MKVPFSFKSEIHKKTKIHQTIEDIGLANDIKTGENEIDDKFLVRSNDHLKTKRFLKDDRRRQAIQKLCEKEYTLTTDKRSLTLRKGPYKDKDLELKNIRFILEELDKLTTLPDPFFTKS